MPEQPVEALRNALDEIDRLRRRSLAFTRFLVYPSIAFLTLSIAILLLRGNVALGVTYALITLFVFIGACTISVSGTSYKNTHRILKAIQMLSEKMPKD
jgi:hypothetical protein